MPQTSLHGKKSQTYLQGGKLVTQSSKRKRRATDISEDSENVYPPSKIPALSHVSYTESCHTVHPLENSCTQHQVSPLKEQQEPATWSELRTSTCFLTPSSSNNTSNRPSPLPSFPWADGSQVWSLMCLGDQKTITQRNPQMFQRHPTLQPRMRAILLDWLIEVCEVYKLHRETYYLAMDYIDRYLSIHQNVPKNQLQLIGITCLFIAAKVEEIYPPKIAEFAYVTDGACTEEEILGKELVILKGLGWNLSPVTAPGWLNIYMQIESGDWSRPNAFIYPQYGGLQYSQAAQLLDLATLDEGSLKFPYSHIAAAAIYHTQGRECALRVSRIPWEQLAPCVKWLTPFAMTTAEEDSQCLLRSAITPVESHSGSGLKATVPNIVMDESHRIQTHVVDLNMLEKAQQRLVDEIPSTDTNESDSNVESGRQSPNESGLLTPPSSSQKNSTTPSRPPPQLHPYT
ncbi:G1/S-specific cyclin-E1 [Apis cerana]|uniref:G1/S-specific cyclin-E1 n=1 Tax=Apis cerana TaxID=7461 RepID=UPI00003BFB23|nr:G1/S-specific cyclin-E1 [Apis cerana]KAG6801269.1 G1/S-specific cyclin-E1 [Apis mellifera caucasica]KAG9431228.1 G1/S-specific cyclin-E1 [Apis mellifera carnica]